MVKWLRVFFFVLTDNERPRIRILPSPFSFLSKKDSDVPFIFSLFFSLFAFVKNVTFNFKKLSNRVTIRTQAYRNIALRVSISYLRVGSQKPLKKAAR